MLSSLKFGPACSLEELATYLIDPPNSNLGVDEFWPSSLTSSLLKPSLTSHLLVGPFDVGAQELGEQSPNWKPQEILVSPQLLQIPPLLSPAHAISFQYNKKFNMWRQELKDANHSFFVIQSLKNQSSLNQTPCNNPLEIASCKKQVTISFGLVNQSTYCIALTD